MTQLEAEIGRARYWLASQSVFRGDWARGCLCVSESVEAWLSGYAHALDLTLDRPLRERLGIRLWGAWSYHWKMAAERAEGHRVDGFEIADLARLGRRPADPSTDMGGDPFRDVVLTGVVSSDPVAFSRFEQEYRPTLEREFARWAPPADLEFGDLWGDLLFKIDGYRGWGSLRIWLQLITRRRVFDYRRLSDRSRQVEARLDEIPSGAGDVADLVQARESLRFIAQAATDAFSFLKVESPPSARVLGLSFRLGLSNGAIAQELGVHPGTASRLRHAALVQFLRHFRDAWGRLRPPQSWPGESLDDLGDLDFGARLLGSLDDIHLPV